MEQNEMKHKFNSIVWIFCEVFRFRTPNWRGRKMRKNDGMEWEGMNTITYHSIPFHSFLKNPNNGISLHTTIYHYIPFHSINSN
jgi:hypothetical protein